MKSIKVETLLMFLLSFVFGVVSILIYNNLLAGEKISFTTVGLIGFVLSIIFGGASMILAITAIYLGKVTEKILMERSEKSIELQNDVYIKTSEALKKIESSTGVTEKRIEDMISGRVGAIATRLVDDKLVTGKNKEELEKEIIKTIHKNETEEEKIKRIEREKEIEAIKKVYKDYQRKLLLAITNSKDVTTLKIGDGMVTEKGTELVDGYYSYNNTKFGVCVFYNHSYYISSLFVYLNDFVTSVAKEISNDTFKKVYIVFNEECEAANKLKDQLAILKTYYKENIIDNIIVVTGTENEVILKILQAN